MDKLKLNFKYSYHNVNTLNRIGFTYSEGKLYFVDSFENNKNISNANKQ